MEFSQGQTGKQGQDMAICMVCGGDHLRPVVVSGPWTVLECQRCRHGVVSPFPDQERLSKLYDSDYFQERYLAPISPGTPAFARRIRQEEHRLRWARKYGKQGRLLDIGCGCGYFLSAAKQGGMEVVGTDVTGANRGYLEQKLQVDFVEGELANLPFADETFAVITLWHTLEHHVNPAATIGQCLSWLKKNGALVVEVPNHDSVDARRYGEKWSDWDLPFHLHHFSQESLRRLLEDAGGQVVAVKTYHSHWLRERLRRTILLAPLARPLARLFTGGSVLMVCKRR